MLMQSFVRDMLDIRQLKDGVFHLQKKLFDPNEIFDQVCSIFSPQAEIKKVAISWLCSKAKTCMRKKTI